MFVIEINAHFNFYKPPYRGTDLPYNVTGYPCGGYNQVNTSLITTVTLKTNVSVRVEHGNGNFSFFFSPTTDGNFVSISDVLFANAEAEAVIVNATVDLSKANGTNGTQGVIQAVFYFDGNGNFSFFFSPTTDGNFVSISDVLFANAEAEAVIVNATVDLSKANGTNGTQGVIQAVFYFDGETSYECADVLIKDNSSTSSSVNSVPHVALTFLFISLTIGFGNLVSL
ncbi:hypothetical protein Glove_99g268 [Diversispora epigaea]|uniref:Copper acquisition factor BIM1-like domain-containing protein n=1 Tax=Diversispora epigaea TaxID=1348612 RepID=A0A397J6L0_9GLOM|nr:hypothetical protein Glove_99g268 [Diversispora epigaea]